MAAPTKRTRLSPAEQSKRFIDTAREMGLDDSSRGEERAFAKVGIRPKKAKPPKKKKGHP